MTFEEALVEDKGKVETRRQKLEWGDAGLPGKSGRTQKARKRAATKTNAKSGRVKPRHYKKRRKEWRGKLDATAEREHSQEWLCHQRPRCRASR